MKSSVPRKYLCKFGYNPSNGSSVRAQTKNYVDAKADGIHNENNIHVRPQTLMEIQSKKAATQYDKMKSPKQVLWEF